MSEIDGPEVRMPSWLDEVTGTYRPLEAPFAHDAPAAGELWYATGGSGTRRIVILLSVDAGRGLARAAVASTERDVATDASLIFDAAELDTPFDVVVETDLVMPVWLRQLGPYVGRVPIAVELIQQAADLKQFNLELEGRRGMPLHGPHDTRVALRDHELEDFWEIAGDCVAEIEAWDAEQALCDPRLLRAALTAVPDYGAIVGVLDARRRGASIGPWTFRRIREGPGRGSTSRVSPDMTAVLGRWENDVLIALERSAPPGPRHVVAWTPAALATAASDRELVDAALAEALHAGARAVDFYTIPRLIPPGLRDVDGLIATLGRRQCAVSLCT